MGFVLAVVVLVLLLAGYLAYRKHKAEVLADFAEVKTDVAKVKSAVVVPIKAGEAVASKVEAAVKSV